MTLSRTIIISSGAVRTARPLDYERLSDVEVQISVQDLGKPSLKEQTLASLKVNLVDVNDSPPRFIQESYNATVFLPTYRDILVIKVPCFKKNFNKSCLTNLSGF